MSVRMTCMPCWAETLVSNCVILISTGNQVIQDMAEELQNITAMEIDHRPAFSRDKDRAVPYIVCDCMHSGVSRFLYCKQLVALFVLFL